MISFGNCSKTRVPSTSHQPCPQTRNYLQAVTYLSGGGLARGGTCRPGRGGARESGLSAGAGAAFVAFVRPSRTAAHRGRGRRTADGDERERGREGKGGTKAGGLSSSLMMMKAGPAIGGGRGDRREAKASCPSRRNYVRAKTEFVKKLIKTSEGY